MIVVYYYVCILYVPTNIILDAYSVICIDLRTKCLAVKRLYTFPLDLFRRVFFLEKKNKQKCVLFSYIS